MILMTRSIGCASLQSLVVRLVILQSQSRNRHLGLTFWAVVKNTKRMCFAGSIDKDKYFGDGSR